MLCEGSDLFREDISVVWRLIRDLFFSCAISLALMMFAIVGLMSHASQGSYSSRPEYKIRARETTKQLMEFILSPVERPSRLVPDVLESIPLIGRASLAAANVVAFPPCFWAVAAFIGIRINRALKIVTSDKLLSYLEAKYGHLGRIRKAPTTHRSPRPSEPKR